MNINPFDILKNAQKIQEQMGAFQEKLKAVRITGSAGGGMVQIDMNGNMDVLALRIAPEAMEEGDREFLSDLIVAAFNNAIEKVRETINREMGSMIPGGMPPGMSGMPGFLA